MQETGKPIDPGLMPIINNIGPCVRATGGSPDLAGLITIVAVAMQALFASDDVDIEALSSLRD